MKKVISDLTLEQQLELEALAVMSDDEINTDDIPDDVVPKNYDFRNIKDYDFTSPLRD